MEPGKKLNCDVINPSLDTNPDVSPIIFLHGMLEWRKTWKKVAPVIANRTRRKAYLLDARNHGNSFRAPEMNYEVMTQDLVEFMDQMNIQKAIIIGHSMGGRTAINFALKHPRRLDALIVEDMTPKDVHSEDSLLHIVISSGEEFLRTIPEDMDEDSGKWMILKSVLEPMSGFIDAKEIKKGYDLDMMPIKKVGKEFRGVFDHDATKKLINSNALVQNLPNQNLKFEGDALFLYGTRPFFNLGKDTSIPKLFPRAVVKRVHGASHCMHLDSSEAYAAIVSDFILHRNLNLSKY